MIRTELTEWELLALFVKRMDEGLGVERVVVARLEHQRYFFLLKRETILKRLTLPPVEQVVVVRIDTDSVLL